MRSFFFLLVLALSNSTVWAVGIGDNDSWVGHPAKWLRGPLTPHYEQFVDMGGWPDNRKATSTSIIRNRSAATLYVDLVNAGSQQRFEIRPNRQSTFYYVPGSYMIFNSHILPLIDGRNWIYLNAQWIQN
jgi:hypothetical protein